MALIKNTSGADDHGLLAGALLGIVRRHGQRRLQAALAGKPERLLRDMGVDPDAIGSPPWAYELGTPHAIGNRP